MNFIKSAGNPLPLGPTQQEKGVNFSLVSKHATSITLVLYDVENSAPPIEILLDPISNKTGDVWHIFLETETDKPIVYGYRIEGQTPELKNHQFNPSTVVLDPYAKAVNTPCEWGYLGCGQYENYHPLGLVLPRSDFNWENDKAPQIPEKDLIIYEMHVRAFTQHSSSHAKAPGTFLGMIEKIPHLVELGINAVELLPIHEFNECEYKCLNPVIHEKLYQFWGYSTTNFFAPMNRYSSDNNNGAAINEFKTLVKELHKNGIMVILDIVFNHTNEGNEKGPVISFKGIDSCIYYLMDGEGKFMNFSGCGNTLNTNHPVVQNFIIDVLRYWVLEMHVDGFRFDLSSVFYRGKHGEVLSISPIVEAISKDPILSKTLLISEPWDAGGLYQVGGFYHEEVRWSEWNGRYRDTVRRFIKGTPNLKHKFASRISGSQDIYGSRLPISSINFIVSHDGFTLNDLVSYNQKHNLYNGENNHDGNSNNESWNGGIEGPTSDLKINQLRSRQMRNFHLALMISQGIPMLLMGDEYAHTKKGNNNSWCHDNEMNWFLWDKLAENEPFYRFYRKLIAFRKSHDSLRQGSFLKDDDIAWLGIDAQNVIWEKDTQFLAFVLFDKQSGKNLYCAFNAQNNSVNIEIPKLNENQQWHMIVNTANESPNDFYEEGKEPIVEQKPFNLIPYSAILLECRNK